VYLYAASGWHGKNMLVGSGLIENVSVGSHLLCIEQYGRRTAYRVVTVEADDTTEVMVNMMRDAVPVLFGEKDTLKDNFGEPIDMNEYSSAVMEDIDRDGDDDLAIMTESGTVYYYNNDGGLQLFTTYNLVLGWGESARCIRLADLDADTELEFVIGLNTGEIFSLGIAGENENPFYTAGNGLAGFDIADLNGDEYPDLLLGYDDGSVFHALSTGENAWGPETVLLLSDGITPITVGTNATPLAMDNNGDGNLDMIIGNGAGDVQLFTCDNNGNFIAQGMVNSNGHPLEVSANAALSYGYHVIVYDTTYDTTITRPYGEQNNYRGIEIDTIVTIVNELPYTILSDENGYAYKVQAVLQGDINRNGIVDFYDFMIFVNVWNLTENEAGWKWEANFYLDAGTQQITFYDFMIFVNSWQLSE
jgi:hypothetical protein